MVSGSIDQESPDRVSRSDKELVEFSKFLKNCDIRVCVKTNEPHCGPVDTTCDSGYSILATPSE